jgi:dTDP-4-dehydrorhamnose 3,5-epimerase
MIDGVLITPLKVIQADHGDVWHAIKSSDLGYSGFGEAYFSSVKSGEIKGWKKHKEMTLNIVVPFGEIQFAMFDDRNKSLKTYQNVILSLANYSRLTVPPNVWMAFKGLSMETSVLLNIASIPHDPLESENKKLNEIDFEWRN